MLTAAESGDRVVRGFAAFRDAVDLDPIARVDDHELNEALHRREFTRQLCLVSTGERQPLAQRKRRGAMSDGHEKKLVGFHARIVGMLWLSADEYAGKLVLALRVACQPVRKSCSVDFADQRAGRQNHAASGAT